jgi:two-component system, sensor histidine kinase and response regulator
MRQSEPADVRSRSLHLRTKLVGGFLLMAAIAGSIGLMGITRIRTMGRADLELYQINTAPLPELANLSVTFEKLRIALRDLLGSVTPDQREQALGEVEQFTADLDRNIGRYDRGNLSPREKTLFAEFLKARASYRQFGEAVVAAGMAGAPDEGWQILRSSEYTQVKKIVLGSLEQIEEMKVQDAQRASEANVAQAKASADEMLAVMAVGVVLALGAGILLTLSITLPVRRIVEALVAVAAGDLTPRLEVDSDDEIGQVSRTLNWTIAELRTAREELIGTREAAVASSHAKSEFLSSMSHEIRTPMNAVLGMAELLSETELNSEQRRYLEVMSNNGEALLELINSILDLAKIESGLLQLESIDFDLNDLIDKLLATFGSRAHAKGLELAARITPGVAENLIGDPLRLRQILVNLIGNALKFTDAGEVILVIDNDPAANQAGHLRFMVSDTGIGIPPNKIESIFSSFTQVDTSTTRKYGGTGLGLTIVQRLVALMGGGIHVESELNRGSKFIFTANFRLSAEVVARHTDRLPDLVEMRVLIVDDNATNREILREMMFKVGAEVAEVGSGVDALTAIKNGEKSGRPFKLILLDMRMPGMDGLEVATRIRRDVQGLMYIVMLSSDDANPQLSRLRESGLDAYLVKPVARRELFEAISRLLAESQPLGVVKFADAAGAPPPDELEISAARILVADDSADNRMLVKAFLQRTPCQLDFAENGAIALEKFIHDHYDLVLMDMQMPVMDGYEAMRSIRSWERENGAPHTNIAALTASAMEEDVVKAREAGCDVHIAKPMKKATLLEVIRKFAAKPAAADAIALAAMDSSTKAL